MSKLLLPARTCIKNSLSLASKVASRFTRHQFQEGLEQRVQNIVHAEVLRERKGCLAKGVSLRPGRLRPVEVPSDLIFGGFSCRNILGGSHEPPHNPSRIPDGESADPHPA